MRLLVTGGAGFIGSNFVRYWTEAHPDDHVVAYDVLTYAGNRPNLADVEDRIAFVHGDVCDLDGGRRPLEDHAIDTVVHFAAESHNCLAVLDPGLFFRTNVLGTQTMLEASRRTGSGGSTTSRPARSTATWRSTPTSGSTRTARTGRGRPTTRRRPAPTTRCGPTSRRSSCRSRSPTAATTTGPSSSPRRSSRCSRPTPSTTSRCRSTLDRRTAGSGSTCVDHCRAVEAVLARGQVGETYHVGSGIEASIEEIADLVLGTLGKPASLKEIVPDRPGPRPPLPARLHQDRAAARLAPRRAVRRGPRRDGPLVRRPPGVVGAVARPGPGRRGRLGHRGRRSATAATATGEGPRDRRRRAARPRPGRRAVGRMPSRRPSAGAARSEGPAVPGGSTVVGLDHAALAVDDRGGGADRGRRAATRRRRARRRLDRGRRLRGRPRPGLRGQRPGHPPRGRGGGSDRRPPGLRLDRLRLRRPSPRPYVEWDEPNPLSVYGRSKLGGEQECPPGSTIVRTSWVCGAHGANMVKTALRLAARRRAAALRRRPARLPTFTADLAAAVATLGHRPPPRASST